MATGSCSGLLFRCMLCWYTCSACRDSTLGAWPRRELAIHEERLSVSLLWCIPDIPDITDVTAAFSADSPSTLRGAPSLPRRGMESSVLPGKRVADAQMQTYAMLLLAHS
jgi:hypothetical protein